MECMKANITDDSNIEYNNIFPKILSHNRKLSTNINIKKMTNRPVFFKDISGSPQYSINYSLIENKIVNPIIFGKPKQLSNYTNEIQNFSSKLEEHGMKKSNLMRFVPQNQFKSARTSLDHSYMDGMGLQQSNSRAQLQQLNRKYVDMADRGETLKREIMEEIDSEKDYIMRHIKRQPEQKEQEQFQQKNQQE